MLSRHLRDPTNREIGKVGRFFNRFMVAGGFNSSHSFGNPYALLYLNDYSNLFLEAFLDDNRKFIDEYIEHVVGIGCLKLGMDSLRVGWGPQTGAGSQSSSYSSYESLNEVMQEVIEEARADREW